MKRTVAVVVAVIVVLVALWWRRDRARAPTPRGAAGAEVAGGRARGAPDKIAPDDPRTQPRAAIRGTVRTAGGGPIAGAQVCSRFATDGLASDELRTPPCATTDAAGAYALDDLLPVRHALAASAPAHQPRSWQNARGEIDSFRLAPGEVRTGVDFALPPGGVEVSGTVEDVSGGAIVGALVAISAGALENVAATTRTDAQGRFTVWSAPGPARLRAHADGYAPGAGDVSAPTARAQLLLTPESSLSGTVVTAGDARPVADAIVAVAGDDGEPEVSARSDAQGRFRLTRLVPGRYKPEASGDGYRGEAGESALLGLGQHVDGVVIVVHPASRVRGTVVIDRGGGKVEPCPRGAVVLADPASRARGRASVERDGAFAILSLVPGRYQVRVRCNDQAAQQTYPPIEVAAGADVEGVILAVTPGAVITGSARTAVGAPVVGAWVSARATDAGEFFPGAFARSGDDGVYRLTGLRAGTYELEAHADGHAAPSALPAVTVAPGGVATADVVFPASGVVAGVVVDPAGQPVPGVQVSAGSRSPDDRATTGDDGRFRLDGVEPGPHRVTVWRGRFEPVPRPGGAEGDDRGEPVTVVAGQTATVRLVVESQDGAITGVVKDAGGEPVGDAWIVAAREPDAPGGAAGAGVRQTRWTWGRTDRPVLTGSDGRFTVGGLAAGRYTVRAYRRGGGETAAEHVATGSATTLTIPGTGSIAGTVAVATGGAAEAFELAVSDAQTGFERRERFAHTGGAFVLRDLPAGTYVVVAESAAGRVQATVPLAADEDRTGVALVLASKHTVTGRFVDLATGAPVPGVRATVTPTVGAGAGLPSIAMGGDGAALSDARGRFTVGDAPGGLVYVVGLNTERAARWPFVRWIVELSGDGVHDVGDVPMVARQGDAPPGDFGWSFAEPAPDADPRTRALTISAVRPGPAATAGLVAGDTIVTVDGHDVKGLRVELGLDLLQVPAGTTVTVGLARGVARSLTAIAAD
ncbi:MAG: carboxypeptidase regulatory-like domain-containing protein [Myxococcales bacterium]|nr:carboxypeptidase regulatory-like domain-containing protein [Myxococcales bacterium]